MWKLVVILSCIILSGCSSYRAKFGGYKDNQHVEATPATSLKLKGQVNRYNIPKKHMHKMYCYQMS